MKCIPLLMLCSLTILHAQELIIYPSSDNRVLDSDGTGRGGESRGEDNVLEALNVGDNANNSVWRSVLKFDLRSQEAQLAKVEKLVLRLTVRQRLLQTPREWAFHVVHIPSEHADRIVIQAVGPEDEFSREGKVIHKQPGGTLRDGQQVDIDVTAAVKASLQGNGILALRLQLDPASNNDNALDQVSFYSGSHEVNAANLRPQLLIAPVE